MPVNLGACYRILLLTVMLHHTAASRRSLQSSRVTISSGTLEFDWVLDFGSYVSGRTLKLLYTLTADGTLRAALVADIASSEYAGLSFGTPHRASSPTVIFTHDYIDGFYLNGYRTADCNAGKGAWAISDTTLEVDGSTGLLVGVFTSSGLSSGRQTVGYTFGPYSGGTLGDHTRPRNQYPYGSIQVTLSVSTPTSSSVSPSPDPATAMSSPSPSPPQTAPTPSPYIYPSANTPSSPSTPPSASPRQSPSPSPPQTAPTPSPYIYPSTNTPSSPSTPPSASPRQSPSPPAPSSPKPPQPSATLRQSSQPLTMAEWVDQTAANDWVLMLAFVVSWAAAPGVLLLVWPFVFDAAMDGWAGVRALTGWRTIYV